MITPPTNFFAANAPIFVARAPGRLDVMGGIADYSGSLVLQLPIDRHTAAMVQLQSQPMLEAVTLRDGREDHAAMSLDDFNSSTAQSLGQRFSNESHWATYVFGVAHACLGNTAAKGFRIFIESAVPEGKGVSSSAALEVSSLAAICAAYHIDLSSEEIARESQWAENHVASAPCGIMDQMASACGRRDHLLRLRCQPATIEGHVAIPSGFRFYGIDSGIRHAVTGTDYGTVRTAAFMGYRMIAEMAGFAVERDGDVMRVHDDLWNGYLANISAAHFAEHFESALPEQMLGADFLAQFGGITDPVTHVRPERMYPVCVATAHPIRENARVELFAELLGQLNESSGAAMEMGHLMFASHASYGACGLGSVGTDRLVAMVAEAGARSGVYGAKITGGGSGGTVAILGTDSAEQTVRDIAARYERETGLRAEVFAGSGAGMAEIGTSEVIELSPWHPPRQTP
jgi:L-arabinokinase